MADIPLDEAHFLGLVFATGLYGVFFVMFCSSVQSLWNCRHRGALVLIVTICLFIIATGNIVIFTTANYSAFIAHRENPGVIAYFRNVRTLIVPLENAVLPSVFMAVAIFTYDFLILWRVYVVWSHNWWIVAAPVILLFIESVLSIVLCVKAAFHTGSLDIALGRSSTALLVNIISTLLIVSRLWWIHRRSQRQDTRNLYKAVVVRFLESSSLYTATQLIYMFTFKPGYLGYFIFTTHIFTMIIAISPMLVVLDLNTVASVSGMHSVGLDVTASPGGGEAEGAITPRSMGLVSTTIAFNSVAFGSDQSYVPPHSAADSDKREDETA